MDIKLKQLMKEKKVTSVALASAIGVSKVTISNLINNKTAPSLETLERVADALDVPLWRLFADPVEVTGIELCALVEHNGQFYKATTVKGLEEIVEAIKSEL